MKKNIIIMLLSVLVIVLVFTSSHFYKETKRMKVDVGYDYFLLIQDTRYSVRDMLSINLQEALQTEYGLEILKSFRTETINKQSQFQHFRFPISEVGEMYYEVYGIIDKALEQKKVSDEDAEIYKDRLNKISYIMMDLVHFRGSMRDLYDMFHGKVDPEISEKIKQRIEADY